MRRRRRRQEHRPDAEAEVQAGAYRAASIEEGAVMGWEVLNGSLTNPYVLSLGRKCGICALCQFPASKSKRPD